MNKELEEAIKTCNKIIKENERIIKILQKTLKSKTEEEYLQIQINAIETVLKHIKNSIPKKRIKEKIDKLKSEKENMFNRIRKLENTIGMSLEEYSELNKLYCKYNEILIKLEVLQEFLEGK